MSKTLTLLVLATLPSMAAAQMDHSTMDHGDMPMESEMHMDMADMVHAEATVNSIAEGSVNVTHGPIAEIGWPAMTMEIPLMEGAIIADGVAAGSKVMMMLGQDGEGMYAIGGLEPAH